MADDWVLVAGASTTALVAPIEEYEERRSKLERAHRDFMLIWNRIITRSENLQMRWAEFARSVFRIQGGYPSGG